MLLREVSRCLPTAPLMPGGSSRVRRALLVQIVNGFCKGVFCPPCFWPWACGDLGN